MTHNRGHDARADLIALEVAAETIDECLALVTAPSTGDPAPSAVVAVRATAWDDAFAAEDRARLCRRLHAEGLTEDALRRAIPALPARTFAQGWAHRLVGLLGSSGASTSPPPSRATRFPFEHVLRPLCAAAWSLVRRPPDAPGLASLQDALLARLCGYTAPALYEEFLSFRENRVGELRGTGSDAVYRSFVGEMQGGALAAFFAGRPVLARLVATLTDGWMRVAQEFVDRLVADEVLVAEATGSRDCRIRHLEVVQAGLSDPHSGGRTVMLLTFRDGSRVVYKPRSLSVDAVWAQLLIWLSSVGGPAIRRHVPTLDRGDYGWQLFCESSLTSAARFYYQVGACLALFRALGASDMHHENLVATADGPVFVDLETLMSPLPRTDLFVHPALRAAEAVLLNSVWRSGVLPDAMLLPTGEVMSYGALAERPAVSGSTWDFINVNTDGMRFASTERRMDAYSNLPLDSNERSRPAGQVAEILSGYREAMGVVQARWVDLWSASGPLAGLQSTPARAIFRPTAVYGAILHMLRDPRRLRSGITWSCRLELDRDESTNSQLGVLASSQLLAAERRALVQGDIPYFLTTGCHTSVWDNCGTRVPDAVRPREWLRGAVPPPIEPEVLECDARFVEWSLGGSRVVSTPRPWPPFAHPGPSDSAHQERVLNGEAQRLVDLVRRRAITSGDGVAWWGRRSLLTATTIGVLGPGLYDGMAGIAVFLAAAAAILRSDEARDLAERTLTTIQAVVHAHRPSRTMAGRTIGVAFGMAGVVYGTVVAARLLEDVTWLATARDAAAWITPDLVRADNTFDIMDGSAGALVALLQLYDQTGEDRWLDGAALCGRRLLEAHRSGYRWWAAPGRPISVGMAHGLAGIGFALCRLSRRRGDHDARELGLEALRLADRAYDEAQHDWSTHLADEGAGERRYWCRWCHGALGVGLAWREQEDLAGEMTASVVTRATRAALGNPMRPSDTLCCGNFGNVDYLLEVSHANAAIQSAARERALWLVSEAQQVGGYACDGPSNEATLGLFPGVAGIGYVLLRAQASKPLPSLLTFA